MFSFVKERKAEAALEAIAPGVVATVSSTTPVERAAALAVANAMLIAGTAQWGREFAHAPMKLPREAAVDALCVLADRHAKLEESIAALSGRPVADPQISACRWEVAATQVVIVTAGASLGKQYAEAARECWKILGAARRHADEATKAMLRYAKAYSVDPVPAIRGRKPDREHLFSLASALPPMFRTRKKA